MKFRSGRPTAFQHFGSGMISSFVAVAIYSGEAMAQGEAPAVKAAVTCSVEMVAMRDGIKLASDVYRPAAPDKYPIVLQRSPYNNFGKSAYADTPIAPFFPRACGNPSLSAIAARGYVVINQDVRGTNRSEGKFIPIFNDGDDGYDSIEWAAVQPWSNGKVAMTGGSYSGMVQWQAAIKRPPHLVTIVPVEAPVSFDNGWPYLASGVIHQIGAQGWTITMRQDQIHRRMMADNAPPSEIKNSIKTYGEAAERELFAPGKDSLPMAKNPNFVSEDSLWYADWLAHPTLDAYWRRASVTDKFQTIDIPVLALGALYDMSAKGTVQGFAGMKQQAATKGTRVASRMILAGGGHVIMEEGRIGSISFGTENAIPADITMRWLDYWLKGIDTGVVKEPAVAIYVMSPPDRGTQGSGFWAKGETFPLEGTRTVRYYISGGHANTLAGNGSLMTKPSGEGVDRYRFDPSSPVQTIGGNGCCTFLIPGGAMDQRPVEMRPDVLVYTGATLTEPMPVIGEPTVILRASSSASSTIYTAKLVDVHPDGVAHNVSEGVFAATGTPSGKEGTYTIRLNPTATVFKTGHKVRLEISSSNYPRVPVTPDYEAKRNVVKIATQTTYWKGTSLDLPVAPLTVIPSTK